MIFSKSIATLATIASMMALAQADMLFISNPTSGTTWKVGDTVFLQWKGNCASMGSPAAKLVDVNLMSGPSTALRFVAKLASIDCSNANTRKEFTIPAEVAKLMKKDDEYSLQVQTEPQPSYSPVFKIDTGDGSDPAGAGTAPGDAKGGESVSASSDPSSHTSGTSGSASPIKNGGSTATGAAVALAAILVAAQLL